MIAKPVTLGPEYFDALYRADPDPWKFASSDYEREKYAATIASLPPRPIDSAFEIGCSIGILTRELARFCKTLLAVDVAAQPLHRARRHCHGLDHVRFRRMQVPHAWPSMTFDFVLLSEVLYYFSPADIRRIAARVDDTLTRDGHILLVHWLGETNYPCSGDDAVEHFFAALRGAAPVFQERRPNYRVDLLMNSR